MNELHLKYQQDTGLQISKQIEGLCKNGPPSYNYKLYDYIKWLEEKITANEKDKNQHSKHYHERERNK